jgi:protein-S-isoprenylcysteine O-methyltransferase Ste14
MMKFLIGIIVTLLAVSLIYKPLFLMLIVVIITSLIINYQLKHEDKRTTAK